VSARFRLDAIVKALLVGFSVRGVALGIATLIVVCQAMEGFRSELRDKILAIHDPEKIAAFEAALRTEQSVMLLILGLIVLVAALNIGAGLLMLRSKKGAAAR
jgi:ABC-type lipoprotein release transport system permease subunit